MPSARYPLHIAVVAFLLARGFGGRTEIIPETVSVIEYIPLRLKCFYKDYSTLPTTTTCRWSIAANDTTIAQFYQNCLLINLYEEIYNFECTNKTANSMIIKSTDRNMHGTVFSCTYFVNGITATGIATIHVSVPVSGVNLIHPETAVFFTTENRKVTFTCNASAAHPKPNITWYTDSQTPLDYRDDVEITTNITVYFDNDGYLYRVMSNLTFFPTNYDNGSRIYCNASNIDRQSISSTRKALLYVQYPPSTPIFVMRANTSVINASIIFNNTLTVRCKSRAIPSPSYIWTTTQNNVSGEYLTIENIMKTDDGKYRCTAYNAITTAGETRNYTTSATIEIRVLYPPDLPKLYYLKSGITKEEIFNSTLRVVKKDNVSILCNSTGKPPPISVWNITKSSNTLSLISIEANASYTCSSSNVMIETEGGTKNGFKSKKLNIHVLFPPVTPIIKILLTEDYVEALNVVNVAENTNISLECSAESDPSSIFSWSHPLTEVKIHASKQLFVNRIQRYQSGTYTCHATNEMVRSFGGAAIGNNHQSVDVDVLYPPDNPAYFFIELKNKSRINTLPLKVVEGDSISVLCNATGNPAPTSLWAYSVADSDILSINSVESNHTTNFTCKSFNMMNDSFGVSRNGTSDSNFSIVVFHPPRNPVIQIQMQPDSATEALNYMGILEGSDFRLYCHAVSNPSASYKWTGLVTSSSAELFVSNIQKNQSGPFTCFVQNEMERSFGNIETGRNNRSIFFNVLYKAAVLYFGATDFENNKDIMTVNKGEEMRIMCKVGSNPCSNTTVIFKGRLVNVAICSDKVTYDIVNSTCSDAGRYICKGKNEYNYEAAASKDFFLYVKCPPQPSAEKPPENNVSAALSDSVVFRFHAAPYHDPGITEFRWFKQGNGSSILLRNDTKTYISSSDLHSVLRKIDIAEADYGMYLLQYNNSIGMNNFTFYLHQIDRTDSDETHQGKEGNIPMVIGIVIAGLVIVGMTLGIVIYIRRHKQKTDSNNGDRSYANICGMITKSGANNTNWEPVYEGVKPIHERGYVEMKEQTYDKLKLADSPEIKDPIYTNLKL